MIAGVKLAFHMHALWHVWHEFCWHAYDMHMHAYDMHMHAHDTLMAHIFTPMAHIFTPMKLVPGEPKGRACGRLP